VSVAVPVRVQEVPAATGAPQGPASAADAPKASVPAVTAEARKTTIPLARSMRRIDITYPYLMRAIAFLDLRGRCLFWSQPRNAGD
jgi:hypothetical protein